VLLCVAQPFATMLDWLGHEMSILATRGSPIVAGFVFTQITSVNLATTV
jgi:NADPH-dependent 7-cyano-7-deazaguanine reductase QueF-like protein